MNTKIQSPASINIDIINKRGRLPALFAALVVAAAFSLSASLAAADYTFDTGAPPTLNPGDTVTIKADVLTTVWGGAAIYYDFATGQYITRYDNVGPVATTYMPFMLGKSYGVTLKSSSSSLWAQLDGDQNHQLITLTEPSDAPQQITIDKVMLANGYGVNGGGLRVENIGPAGTGLTVNGDIIFANNVATNNGGAVQTGHGTMTFTGNVFFGANTAAANGGAISFEAAGSDNQKLIFQGDAIFANNTTSGIGGAIYGNNDKGVIKTLEFQGAAIFDGNKSGVGGNTSPGGAIGGGTDASGALFNITFLNNAAFTHNFTPGLGAAIYTRAGNIVFGGPGEFDGAQIYFSRNVATVGTSAGRYGGGAIECGTNSATNTSSVFFLNPSSHVVFDQNVCTSIQPDGSTGGSNNSGMGGAMRASSGVYMLAGQFEFIGNQASGRGGAIYVGSGVRLTGYDFRDYGILYSGNTDTYKYQIQIAGNALFQDNYSVRQGGAISTDYEAIAGSIYIGGNTRFINNVASQDGGAIFFGFDGGSLTLDATNGDITFQGNRRGVTGATLPTLDDVDTILANNSGTDGFMAIATNGSPNDIYFTGAGTMDLTIPVGRTVTMGGGIMGGSVTVTMSGGGLWVFGTNANTNLTTTTQILSGTFQLQNATYGNNGSGRFTLGAGAGAGATLMGYGKLNEPTIANTDFNIIVGDLNDTAPRTLSFGYNFTITSGTVKLDLFNTANATNAPSDAITVGSIFTANGITSLDVTGLANGNYPILTAASIQAASNNFRLLVNGAALTARNQGSTVNIIGNQVVITGTMLSLANVWNGASGGIWRDGMDTTWRSTTDTNEKYFRNTDSVTFTDTGAGSITISPAGVRVADMTVNSAADYTFTGTAGIATTGTVTGAYVTPTQKLVKQGAGTLTFENTATNSFAGGIDIEAGVLAFNDPAQLTTDATAAITFTGNAALKLDADAMTLADNIAVATGKTGTLDMGANNLDLAGSLSGDGALAKTGSSTLSLSADSSAFAGDLQINQGGLALANTAKLGGTITLEAGTRLDGDGASTGSLVANAGSFIQLGAESILTSQTLTLGNLTMDGATLRMDLYANAPAQTAGSADTLKLTGAYTAGTGANILDIETLKVGVYDLGNFGGFADQSHTVLINSQSQVGARQTATIANVAGDVILTTTSDDNRRATWTGASGVSTWNISAANWTLDTSAAHTFAGGDSVIFGSAGAGIVNIEGGNDVSSMTVASDANYTFTGGEIKADSAYVNGSLITGDGKLTKSGAGTLTFANSSNIFRGGIELDGGAIAFDTSAQLNTAGAGISFGGAASLVANAASLTLAENISVASGVTATLDTNGNNLLYTGTLNAGDAASGFAKAGAGALRMNGNNSNFDGKVTVGAGTLLLTGSVASLGGDVAISSGATFGGNGSIAGSVTAQQAATLQVGTAAASGTLDMGALTLGNQGVLTGAGRLDATGITLGSATGDKVFADIAAGAQITVNSDLAGAATLVKQGDGILTINAQNPATALDYAGTEIDAGTVQLRNLSNTAHTVTLNGGWLDVNESMPALSFVSGANAADGGIVGTGSAGNAITLGSGVIPFHINGALSIRVDPGQGNVTELTGQNNYNGGTGIYSGMLMITSLDNIGGISPSGNGNIGMYNNTALRISGTEGNVIQGNRFIVMNGSATIIVDAGMESSWPALTATSDGYTITKQGGGVLSFTGAAPTSNLIAVNLEAGTLGLLNSGALGTIDEVALANTINVLGASTTIQFGNRVEIKNPINLNANTVLLDVPNGSATYDGVISGNGGITKTGPGELVLNNPYGTPSTYSGPTTITSGFLRLGSPTALSPNSSVYNIGPNGTFDLDGNMVHLKTVNNQGVIYVGAINVAGNGLLPNGTGTSGFVGNNGNLVYDAHGTLYQASKLTVDSYNGGAGSKLILNWGLTSASDYHIAFDSLSIAPGGSVTGTTTIIFSYQGQATSQMNRRGAIVDSLDHNVVDDNVNAGLHFTGTFVVNNLVYAFRPDEYNDLVTEKIGVVPKIVAAKAVDVVALFSNKTALDSLDRRFAALRTETGHPNKGFDAWVGGAYREDKLRDTIYNGFGVNTAGVQGGVDFIDRDTAGASTFFIGLCFDYLSATMNSDVRSKYDYTSLYSGNELDMISQWAGPTRTENSAYGVGVYGDMKNGPWYVQAIMRASKDKYRVRLPLNSAYALDMPGSSFGGSFEVGYTFDGSPSGWIFEPQGQIILQRTTVDPTADTQDDIFNLDTVQSMAGRVGVRILKHYEWKSGSGYMITPYVRGSILHEFAGRNKLTVNNDPVNNPPVESDLGGSTGVLEAGVTWRVSERWDVSFNASYYYGDKYYGYTLNGGLRFNW